MPNNINLAQAVQTPAIRQMAHLNKDNISYKCYSLFDSKSIAKLYFQSNVEVITLKTTDHNIQTFDDIIHLRHQVLEISAGLYTGSLSKEVIMLLHIDQVSGHTQERIKSGNTEHLFLHFASCSQDLHRDSVDKLTYMNLGNASIIDAGWKISPTPILSINGTEIIEAYYCKLIGAEALPASDLNL